MDTNKDMSESMKLEGASNYSIWAFKMKQILLREKVWSVVETHHNVEHTGTSGDSTSSPNSGTVTEHTTTVGAATTAGAFSAQQPAPQQVSTALVPDTQELKNKAFALITLSVKDTIIPHLMSFSDPALVWTKLKNLYESTSSARRLMLKHKLYTLKFPENKSVEEYLKIIGTLVTQLGNLGTHLADEEIVDVVLTGLPSSWSIFRQMMTSRPILPSFADLESALLLESVRRDLDRTKEDEDEVLYSRTYTSHNAYRGSPGRGRGRFGSRGARRGSARTNLQTEYTHQQSRYRNDGACNYCGSFEHFERDCHVKTLELKLKDLELELTRMKRPGRQVHIAEVDQEQEDVSTVLELDACMAEYSPVSSSTWFLDSGASNHITGDQRIVSNVVKPNITTTIKTASGAALPVVGKGIVTLSDNKILEHVLYVPGVQKNLLSVGALTDKGHRVVFDSKLFYVFEKHDPNKIYLQGTRDSQNNLYRLQTSARFFETHVAVAGTSVQTPPPSLSQVDLWHRRIGHLNFQSLYHLSNRDLITGVPKLPLIRQVCETCVMAKQHKERVPKQSTTSTSQVLELVHSDLCGPFRVKSLTGARYFLTFIDDYSRRTWVYFLAQKSETLEKFQEFRKLVEAESSHKILCLRTDRGGEYLSNQFISFCKQVGISRQLTTAYTPHQNGKAERKNRTLMETARALGYRLPGYLWEECVRTANYITNRCPTKALKLVTPLEKYSGLKPDLSHLRIYGCKAYVHIPREKRSKLEVKSVSCILVGYDDQSKAYRCFEPSQRRILINKDIVFDETNLGLPPTSNPDLIDLLQLDYFAPIKNQLETLPDSDAPEFPSVLEEPPSPLAPPAQSPLAPPVSSPVSLPLRRSTRLRQPPIKLDDYFLNLAVAQEISHEPQSLTDDITLEEAVHNPASFSAMKEEINSIQENGTWDLVDLPKGHTLISARWVFKLKTGSLGTAHKYKARLVARGFEQRKGIDYTETFAPTVKWSTIRLVTALAASQSWDIHHLDVVTAFLNGELDSPVYMEQPPVFQVPGKEHLVCRLKKSLYGLKQSPRAWYTCIDSKLQAHGLHRSQGDHNLYFFREGKTIVLLVLYVDDIFLTGNNPTKVTWVKNLL